MHGERVSQVVGRRFFGGFGFGGFGGTEEEEQIPKGNDVYVELEVTLKDLYLGKSFKVGEPPPTWRFHVSLVSQSQHFITCRLKP